MGRCLFTDLHSTELGHINFKFINYNIGFYCSIVLIKIVLYKYEHFFDWIVFIIIARIKLN